MKRTPSALPPRTPFKRPRVVAKVWPKLDNDMEHQEMDPENPNHNGQFPTSTCGGRVTRHKIKKEGKNKGKFFFTCDCQGEDSAGKRLNGIMMEIEFIKNPGAVIRCKTIELAVKQEQIKYAKNLALGKAGIQKTHVFQEFWDQLMEYADELSEEEQGNYLGNLEEWHNLWVRGEIIPSDVVKEGEAEGGSGNEASLEEF